MENLKPTDFFEPSTSDPSEHQPNWIESVSISLFSLSLSIYHIAIFIFCSYFGRAEDMLKKTLSTEDDFKWQWPPSSPEIRERKDMLKYLGGVDISFSKEDPSIACGAIVVLDLQSLNVVYDDFLVVKLEVPYVPGFLAFREAPVLLRLLKKMKDNAHPFYPQVLMVDGNGLLHPRGKYLKFGSGFGLACHMGVLANLPTIGVGKNLHHVDGLTLSGVKERMEADRSTELINLVGNSGRNLGVAMRSTVGAIKPIFISVGHRVSLATAIKIVKITCKYRVPEPIRQADIRSRDYLRKHTLVQSSAAECSEPESFLE